MSQSEPMTGLWRWLTLGSLVGSLLLPLSCKSSLANLQQESLDLLGNGGAGSAGPSNFRAYSTYLLALDAERIGDLDSAESLLRRAIEYDPGSASLLVRLGRVKAQQREMDEAIAITRRALVIDSTHVEANFQLATLLQFNNELAQAEAIYAKVLQIDPDNQDACLELANLYRAQGKTSEGLALLEQFQARGGTPGVQALMLMSALHKDSGQTERAEKELLEVLDQYPEFPQAQRALLDLYLANGSLKDVAARLELLHQSQPWQSWIPESLVSIYARLEDTASIDRILAPLAESDPELEARLRLEAVEELASRREGELALQVLEPMLGQGGDNERAWFYAGYLYGRRKAYDRALEYYGHIPPSSSYYSRALEQRALALQAMERNDEAVALLKGYLEQEPDQDDLRFTLVTVNLRAGRVEDALAICDELEKRIPNDPEVAVQRAFVLHEMKREDDAVAILRSAIVAQPTQMRLYEVLAAILGDAKRYLEAVEVLKEALKIQPESESLRFSLGGYYDSLKMHDEAIAQMFKLLESNKNNAEAMNFIGYTWAEKGIRLTEAETMIRRALELDPDNGYITDSLGWVYYQAQRYEEAVKVLERAVELTQNEPVIVEHLGDAYQKSNQLELARKMFLRAEEEFKQQDPPDPAEISRVNAKRVELEARGVGAGKGGK